MMQLLTSIFIAMALAFSVEHMINCVQNERALCDIHADSFEEDKESA